MLRLLIPALIVFITSCTVTKRVHRPGFHVEWKKRQVAQTKTLEKPSFQTKKTDIRAVKHLPERKAARLSEERIRQKGRLVVSNDAFSIGQKGVDGQPPKLELKLDSLQTSDNEVPQMDLEKERERKESRMIAVSDGFQTTAKWLFFVGGFLLLGTLFAYFGLWALESLFYSLVFNGGGIIAGILGFILFLIIFVIVFIAYIIVQAMGGAMIGLISGGIAAGLGGLLWLIGDSILP